MNTYDLHSWGKQVAEAYIRNRVNPNESITKIAEDNELSRIQIQRVVEVSNTYTNEALRRLSDDKTFTFPLADLEKITAGSQHTKKASTDLSFPDSVFLRYKKDRVEPLLKEASAALAEQHTANASRAMRDVLKKLAAKAQAAQAAFSADLLEEYADLSVSLDRLEVLCRSMVLDKTADIKELPKVAALIDNSRPDMWVAVFGEMHERMMKLGYAYDGELASVKEMLQDRDRSPSASIPNTVPIRIINGSNPVVRELKEVGVKMQNLSAAKLFKHEIDSLTSYVVVSERDFSTQDAVNEYLLRDLQKVAMEDIDQPADFFRKLAAVPLVGLAMRAATYPLRHPIKTVKGAAGLAGHAALSHVLGASRRAAGTGAASVMGATPHAGVDPARLQGS